MANLIPKLKYGVSEIAFYFPPTEDDGEKLVGSDTLSKSANGTEWRILNYIEAKRAIKLSFLTDAQKTALQTFYENHASKGKSFRWYTDEDDSTYKEYVLERSEFDPRKVTSVGATAFIWSLALSFKRLLGSEDVIPMIITILNNQATPLSIPELALDANAYTAAKVLYELRRMTGSTEKVAIGELNFIYREATDLWEIADTDFGDADIGVTFTILSSGQVQYISSNLSGSDYEGKMQILEIIPST